VPLIFPWFGPNAADPKLPAHGFARTTAWNLESISRDGNRAIVELSLQPTETTRKLWPHEFELRSRVIVGSNLQMELTVRNSGDQAWRFEEALHTYLAAGDVRKTSIFGLAGRDYLDKVQGGRRIAQGREPITITGETDRVYLNTRDDIVVDDPAESRRIRVSKDSSNDTVVWNPWIAKAKALADFGDDEWPAMLCIESANVGENAVELAPGQTHTIKTTV
jgi:glucose-6-phosphate 1-epimerase